MNDTPPSDQEQAGEEDRRQLGLAGVNDTPPSDPPSEREQELVRAGMPAVKRAAKSVAKSFHRLVQWRELLAVGTFALYRVARTYEGQHTHEFGDYAFRRVRDAMLAFVRAERFQDRVRRAGMRAADRLAAFWRDDEYDVMQHDETDARRHVRRFFDDLLAATFTGAVEEATAIAAEDPGAVEEEWQCAIEALASAMPKLSDQDIQILALHYRENRTLQEAGDTLGISYATVRRHHTVALAALREELGKLGVDRAPPRRAVAAGEDPPDEH